MKNVIWFLVAIAVIGLLFGEAEDGDGAETLIPSETSSSLSDVAGDPVKPAPHISLKPKVRSDTFVDSDLSLIDPDKAAVVVSPSQASLPKPSTATSPANSNPRNAQKVYVTGSRVNVRSGPGIANPVVATLPQGTELNELGSNDGWTRLSGRFNNRNIEGWMSSQFLSREKPKARQALVSTRSTRAVAPPTNREIARAKQAIINESIRSYSGSCPCPYNTDRAGRRCGGRSAWSRPGGRSPMCYDSDVSKTRLDAFLARHRYNN